MGRLMPGRVRHEGTELYKSGQVLLQSWEDQVSQFLVTGFEVTYDSQDRLTFCACEFFAQKTYCQHVAAVESFLQQEKSLDLEPVSEVVEPFVKKEEHVFASRFLEALAAQALADVTYRLSVFGELSPYANKLLWTIKIQRLPDQRSYVIRDIVAFLNLVGSQGHYQIGKNYYEPLAEQLFEPSSRQVLAYLFRLWSSDSQTFFPERGRYLYLPAGFFEEGIGVLRQLPTCDLNLHYRPLNDLTIYPLDAEQAFYRFKVTVELDSIDLLIHQEVGQFLFDGQYLFWEDRLYRLDQRQQRLVRAIQTLPEPTVLKRLSFSLEDQGLLAQQLLEFACLGPVDAPQAFLLQEFTPRFNLDVVEEELKLQVVLAYQKVEVSRQDEYDQLPFTSNPRQKALLDRTLIQLGFPPTLETSRSLPRGAELYEFLEHGLARLKALGEVSLSPAVQQLIHVAKPTIHLERREGLLAVDFDFSSLDQADIHQALTSLRQQDPYFVSQSGRLILFDDEVRRISETLLRLRAQQVSDREFQLSSLASFQVKEVLSRYEQSSFSDELTQMTLDLANPEGFAIGANPLFDRLRDYQRYGVHWLSVLDHYGFGGVLADDMGLGKTLQTIAFLSKPLSEGKKVLILAPSSLIYNWQDEWSKFYPQATIAIAQGSKDQREAVIAQGAEVTLTSYHSFRQDLELYQARSYDYLILDEAQALKNSQTKLAQALREFQVPRCFALSGTPIENRLLEIWSLFQIVLPGLFAGKQQFNSLPTDVVAQMIKPFILRRKKEDVLPELPAVTEMSYHNDMTKEQKALYLAQLERMKNQLAITTSETFGQQKLAILAGLTRLRQICNTPKLFMPFEGSSGKLDGLRELLIQLKENGHRALLFSQFTSMLALVEDQVQELGLSAYTLTGSTPAKERQAMTKAFNKGSRDLFLMSLKAGGVGLNVTGADTVILIDLWWNPAVEMQAVGRAHRLGQNKPVQVYRLITRGSIEEKILDLQENKRQLMQDLLEGQELQNSLTLEELKVILGIS